MYDLLGLPASSPAAVGYQNKHRDTRPLQMKKAYKELLAARSSDTEAWREVHRIIPAQAEKQLLMACLETSWREAVETMLALMKMPMENTNDTMLSFMQRADGWREAVEQLLALTESPAMYFVRLGDGVDFDERDYHAAFGSRDSVEKFRRRYPAWIVREEFHAEQLD